MNKDTLEIYKTQSREFFGNVLDYIKGTKGEDFNKYPHWQELFEEVEQWEGEFISLLENYPISQEKGK